MRADVLVIGAGIVGAACAFRLAERGLSVAVLEQFPSSGQGSTGRSAAGVRVQFRQAVNIALSGASIAEYAEMPESGYRAQGYLLLVPPEDWTEHLAGVALQRAAGHDIQVLAPDEAQRVLTFEPDGLAGATFGPRDGVVDPHGLCAGYLRRARELGARFVTDARVTALSRRDGDWHARTPGGDFAAPQLVNAAGAWAGEVAALAGLELPVWPARRMVYATGPLALPRPVPMTFDLASGVWLRSEGERVILGRANPADRGWREGLDWDWLEHTLEPALARFPWLADAGLDRAASWWGHYEQTPDGQPVLGERPDAPGWLDACGFSGHGVMQAAAVGRVIAQEAAGEAPFIDIAPLRLGRFAREVRPADVQV